MTRTDRKVAATLLGAQLCLSLLLARGGARAQDIDNPLPVEIGVTRAITLNRNERSFFKVSLPAGAYKVALDIHRDNESGTNLQGALSILDQDGAPVTEGAIRFNEIDVDYRGVYGFSLKAARTLELKLSSDQDGTKFWLTVVKESDPSPVPLFGKVLPTPMLEGQPKSGRLDSGESAYYSIALRKGDYKAFLDLTNADAQKTNLQGYVALLDADGGNQERIVSMNEIDVSYRQAASFSIKNDATLIVRVKNGIHRVNYSVKITAATPQ